MRVHHLHHHQPLQPLFLADVMFQHRPLCHVDYNYPVRFSHQLAEQHNQRQIADRHSLSPHQYYVDVNAESLANYPLLDCRLVQMDLLGCYLQIPQQYSQFAKFEAYYLVRLIHNKPAYRL